MRQHRSVRHLAAASIIVLGAAAVNHGTQMANQQVACEGAYAVQTSRPPSADVGAYFFDGWSGSYDGRHFSGLLQGPYGDRQPLSGWSNRTTNALVQQLVWAHKYGITFFSFDWYFNAQKSLDTQLNHSLGVYESLRNHHGVRFSLVYVNTRAPRADFVIPADQWERIVTQWVTREFSNPDYLKVDGRPVFMILDSSGLNQQLGGRDGVNAAFATLRAVARIHGFPGVFIIGGIHIGPRFDWRNLGPSIDGETYDAVTQYAYPAAPGLAEGERPYDSLINVAIENWSRIAERSPVPYVPDVMVGWDPRPWQEKVGGALFWYRRTPAQLERFVRKAVEWSAQHSHERLPGQRRPMIMLEAWNELGEGSYIEPTVGNCHRYGNAVARALASIRN